MRNYRLFGEVLATADLPDLRAMTTDLPATVAFRVVTAPPAAEWTRAHELFATPPASGRTEPDFRFFRLPDRDVIRIEGSADFHLLDDEMVCHLINPDHAFLVEIVLAGLAFSFWLERRGVPTLHGSAASIDGSGVGFLAARGTGKSSLVTYLTANGDPLITEDLLVLKCPDGEPHVQTGLAQLRLWPEQAARFVDDWESLERPHPGFTKRKVPVGAGGLGVVASGPVPLRRLFVLDRLDDTGHPELIELPSAAAVVLLLRNSYLPEIGEKFGWQKRRLIQLTDLLAMVPVRVLRYPTGLEHLPAVRAAIAADLADG